MGLAEPRKRTKISHDPNNTTWTRSTDNYGQRIMKSQGWMPGSFLGAHNAAHTQHFTAGSASFVRAVLKDDTLGLGAKPHSKKAEDEVTGLDAFQGLLGRLNGKSEADLVTEQRRREDVKLLGYVERRWKSMSFVRGGMLAQEKMPESSVPRTESDDGAQEKDSKDLKKKRKKERLKVASGDDDKPEVGTSDGHRSKEKSAKVKDKKKEKKKKKKREGKNREPDPSESDSPSQNTAAELSKSKKKRKRKEKDKPESLEETADKPHSPVPKAEEIPASATKPTRGLVVSKENRPVGRQALRSRHIEQKKRALMDDKSLNEIFMVTS